MSDPKSGTLAPLTEGSVRRHLIQQTVPMIWGIFALMAFNVADTYFVGQLGARELAAMSFTFPVVMVFISLAIGLSAGTSSVLARAAGRGDMARVQRLTTDGMILAFLATILLTIIGLLTIDPLFQALGAQADLIPLIRDYMVIWYLGIVFLIVPLVGMSAIRAMGNSKVSGYVMTGSAILNIVLDPLLIFGLLGFPRLELEGAAIATVIARASTFAAAFWFLHFKLNMLTFSCPPLAELRESWRRILHVGLPAAGTNMIIPVATGVVVALIAQYGETAVAGFGAATRIESMTLVVFYALSAIIGPFAGQNLGAGKQERIIEALSITAWFAFLYGLGAALVLALLAEPLAGLFSESPEVVAVTSDYLLIVPISYGAAGIVMVANAVFNGIGLPGKGVIVSVTRMVIIYVPAAYLGAWLFGLPGIFVAAAFANLSVGIGSYLWNRNACRQQRRRDADQSAGDIGVA